MALRASVKALGMFRSSRTLLGGAGMKEYHEWHLHEPLLQNYEGWRILDNPPLKRSEAWFWDIGGYGRHIDPIIDDPRLSHSQRVCRLYRWSLKELRAYLCRVNNYKFNLAYKVVRNRFEKYRHVRDPAMCDMMVRETQKYLRETCNYFYMRTNSTSPFSTAWWSNQMWHPDNTQVYDHWTPVQVQIYDDAKMHRYKFHNPVHGEIEVFDRWGESNQDGEEWWQKYIYMSAFVMPVILIMKFLGVFWDPSLDTDVLFNEWIKANDCNMQAIVEYEERCQRSQYSTASIIRHDWDYVMGAVRNVTGDFSRGGRYFNPGEGFPAKGSEEEKKEIAYSADKDTVFFPDNWGSNGGTRVQFPPYFGERIRREGL